MLTNAKLYYADPLTFNDPLDCSPDVCQDLDVPEIELLCFKMLSQTYGNDKAKNEMHRLRYNSTENSENDPNFFQEVYYKSILSYEIKKSLYKIMDQRGVLSLSSKWNCPLMWSHYGDQHQGLCIEYETKDNRCSLLRNVDYKSPRIIKLSDIFRWKIDQCPQSKEKIEHTFFFSKAPNWRYECEWRDVHPNFGNMHAPLWIKAIIFGLRCELSVQTAVVKLYSNYTDKIKFYSIYPYKDTYKLKRSAVDVGYIEACGVSTPLLKDFEPYIENA